MSEILTESSGGVLTITLNRPDKRNALNDGLISSLKDALREAGREPELRAVGYTSTGWVALH